MSDAVAVALIAAVAACVAAVLGFIAAVLTFVNNRRVSALHVLINSNLEKQIATSIKAALAEGFTLGSDSERKRTP